MRTFRSGKRNFRVQQFKGHLKTVLIHKYFVGKYCFMCGLYKQGITHDLSKFSPKEFIESYKYYTGTRSPIDSCKEDKGYSIAWLHHRGRNLHHWETWLDNFEKGTTRIKMPFKYALEMICDFLGAGRAYNGKSFTIEDEYQWWLNKRKVALLHPDTLQLLDIMFSLMRKDGIKEILTNKTLLECLQENYEMNSDKLNFFMKYIDNKDIQT